MALFEDSANASIVSLICSGVISLTRGNVSANGTSLGAHTLSGHPPSSTVATWPSPTFARCHGATVLALRPAWASWQPTLWPCECTKSVMRLRGAIWLSFQRPESSGEMRPLGRTDVASVMVRPAPRTAKEPRWTRCFLPFC